MCGTLLAKRNSEDFVMDITLVDTAGLLCLMFVHVLLIKTYPNGTKIWSEFVKTFLFVWWVTRSMSRIGKSKPKILYSIARKTYNIMTSRPKVIISSKSHLFGY
jgi:hypothetical protein